MKFHAYRTKQPDTTYLQGCGWVAGTPAGELKPGDKMIWNNGYISTVDAIICETEKTITINETWADGVTKTPRIMKKNRIVARPTEQLIATGKTAAQLKIGDWVMCNKTPRRVIGVAIDPVDNRIVNIETKAGTYQAPAGSIIVP